MSQDTTGGMGMNSAKVAAAQLTRVNCTSVSNGVVRMGSVSKLLSRGAPVMIGQVASKAVFMRGRGSWCSLGSGLVVGIRPVCLAVLLVTKNVVLLILFFRCMPFFL